MSVGGRSWPSVLTALMAGRGTLVRRHRLGHGRGHGRERVRGPAGRVRGAAARQGRDARRARRAGTHDARPGHAVGRPVAGGRHRRDGRGPRAHRQHLDDGGARRRGVRDVRWSSTATGRRPRPAGRPTCSRSSASSSTSAPDGVARDLRRGRDRVLLRPGIPPRHAPRGRAASRDRGADRVQLPGSADQPRPDRGRRDRLCRPADGAGHGRSVLARAGRHRAGVPWGRRPRRADHHHHLERLDGGRRAGRAGNRRPGRRSASQRSRPTSCAAGDPRIQRRGRARGAGRDVAAAPATPSCSTPRRRSRPSTRPFAVADAVLALAPVDRSTPPWPTRACRPRREPRSTRAPQPRCSGAGSTSSHAARPATRPDASADLRVVRPSAPASGWGRTTSQGRGRRILDT